MADQPAPRALALLAAIDAAQEARAAEVIPIERKHDAILGPLRAELNAFYDAREAEAAKQKAQMEAEREANTALAKRALFEKLKAEFDPPSTPTPGGTQ